MFAFATLGYLAFAAGACSPSILRFFQNRLLQIFAHLQHDGRHAVHNSSTDANHDCAVRLHYRACRCDAHQPYGRHTAVKRTKNKQISEMTGVAAYYCNHARKDMCDKSNLGSSPKYGMPFLFQRVLFKSALSSWQLRAVLP